ncbi:hypothetical protein CYY_008817 [Polysphondylium violaceum]|uniref:ABC transporter domain-containing protein n=1 Tax=Polysphondylium violaceum TaxID=133409 RepID=A0A8J4PMF1_9MYCE|nr:hypothetical protein CYY_008817 [Polysphondylium violaceum]
MALPSLIAWMRQKFIDLGWFINGLPITVFYKYLWLRNKTLLFKTITVHYIIPIILELMPWYASKRKIGNYLRTSRVEITHLMSTNGPYSHSMMIKYVILTIYYAILDNFNTHLISIVSLENKLQIRRLVMEKLLYSEIGAFDFLRKKKNIGPAELEFKLSSSINTTISFFTYTVPEFVASLYAFSVEGYYLWSKKKKIDPLIVLHPILIAIYQKVSQKLREHLVEGNELKFKDTYNSAMSKMISNTAEGLSDIQINNLQETQLGLFDNLIDKEMSNTQSLATLVSRTWRSIHSRSVFEFGAEVWVAHKVMERQNINNQEYRTTLLDINRLIRLGNRLFYSLGSFKNIYKHQKKVKKLLNIPTFIEEDSHLKYICRFDELKVSNLKFSYENKFSAFPSLPVLDLQGEMVIYPGKRYALIGQNRSGKSTLNHLLCKLYTPSDGEISMNGIPYSEISRSSIRRMISYVSQRPFIFPGTIMDNIRVGNPSATEEQVLEAADAAGVFAFADDDNLRSSLENLGFSDEINEEDEYDFDEFDLNNNNINGSVVDPIKTTTTTTTTTIIQGVDSPIQPIKSSSVPLASPTSNVPHNTPVKTTSFATPYSPRNTIKTSSFALNRKGSSVSNFSSMTHSASGINVRHRSNSTTEASGQSSSSAAAPPCEEMESNKLVKRVWSVLNLASMGSNDESDDDEDEEERRKNLTPTVVPQLIDAVNHPILNQVVEAGGKNLSGGFAQSIALARIFVRTEAKIIILDESMSQMDAFKKREIIFPKLFQFAERNGITLIIVTHDIVSVQNMVDHIFVLDHGKLVHQGSHKQLMEDNAQVYYKLLGLRKKARSS